MTYFVAAVAPSSLRASRYCRAIVRSSISLAAAKMRLRASLKPSASQDGRLPLALGLQDGRLLLALGDVDLGLALALRLGDDGATGPLGGEHAVHGVLHLRAAG